jgi:hypothetical protein
MATFFIAGFVGGVFRGVVGIVKYSTSYKDVEIRPWYFAGMVVVSGIIGVTTAWIIQDLGVQILGVAKLTPAVGALVGYAGGDLLENIYKILVKKDSLFK